MSELPSFAIASKACLQSMDSSLKSIAASQALLAADAAVDYLDIENLIRRGLGPSALPVGTQVKVNHAVYGELIADVIGHNIDLDPLGRTPYSTTFLLHTLLEGTQYDAQEAFYYAAEGLPADTYNFTIASTYGSWAAGTYQFTIANALAAGGQLVFSGYANAPMTERKVFSFASRTTTTKTEECVITAGSGGTSLGTLEVELNHPQRASYGSNNPAESAIRQWLNSAAAANAWWQPQTNFDRPPNYTNRPGFLNGMPADFLAAIGETDHKTALNTVTDGGGITTIRDKIFLLSREEIFGTGENGQNEGQQYPYFVGLTDEQRKKYYANGSVSYWWLRSPTSGNATHVRLVSTSGALDSNLAIGGYGVAAAWTIY